MALAIVNLISTAFLFGIWSTAGWQNVSIKFLALGFTLWNLVNVLTLFGFVVKL